MSSELFITRFILPLLVWVLFCLLPLVAIILAARDRLRAPVPVDDFEEFWCDLHTFATDADFTRAEAQGLYEVWQRWIGEGRKVETSQEKF